MMNRDEARRMANDLVSQMTLEEKASQLGSHWEMREEEDTQGEVAPMEEAMQSGNSVAGHRMEKTSKKLKRLNL